MILLGVNAFSATGEAGRRQAEALAAWRALRGVRLANLQWPDEVFEVEGFATHAVLRSDSRLVTGRAGPRKPVVPEVFDRLAEIAAREGCRWFGFANADVTVTQGLVDRIEREGREGYAVSRTDVEPGTGRALEVERAGVDAFVVSAEWWGRNRRRFRAYIAGEPIWDNVYASVLLCHADAVLLDRPGLLLHERHGAGSWAASPYAPYLRLLAALDAPYFSLWARYHHERTALEARGAGEDETIRLQRQVFRHAPSPAARLVQLGRAVKAHARYRLAGRRGA